MTKNVVVVGGSYVGLNLAESLAKVAEGRFRVLLIERNSHFQHLFAFPRYAVTTSIPTHKAFIPYQVSRLGQNGSIIQAAVTRLTKSVIQLDRNVTLDGRQTHSIPYFALAIATGTKLTPPSTLPGHDKLAGTEYLREHASQIEHSNRIVVIGAGAVGVQMGTDIKELYPDKTVTLVHSREKVMNCFHPALHEVVRQRNSELGIDMVVGRRVKLPKSGYPVGGDVFDVELTDGTKIPADFAIICTDQTPQSEAVRSLSPNCIDDEGFVKVRATLQLQDEQLLNVFALGDIAATAAPKAARPATKQADVVTKNVVHLLDQEPLEKYEVTDPAAIHLTLGITKSVIFQNPSAASNDEPAVLNQDDGSLDMGIDGVWARRGAGVMNAML
ncbi:putative amid-like NADH oxidoreductase [Lophiostoma macrostomum CBS 122681]|uniref:Putative amid-like NADH oxidoreductase n=1 Tax=Lophiostoma macrostomum CBS 122681 TaxID=1314788 RepID=A0A6A6SIB0_9PLEO|nr:putative amid-like NADH oxidoreductase [Lophiostoma macrostomum CBS 122681]